jgi:hypothetical protein
MEPEIRRDNTVRIKSDTQSVRLETDGKTALEFIADPRNLPRWAVGFCRGIRHDGNGWVVETRGGECPLVIEADRNRGTIDFHLRPAPGVEASAYSRVIDCGDGTEYVFTQFSDPAAPDGAFEANVAALKEELVVLRSVLKARDVCPA